MRAPVLYIDTIFLSVLFVACDERLSWIINFLLDV